MEVVGAIVATVVVAAGGKSPREAHTKCVGCFVDAAKVWMYTERTRP